MSDAVSFVEIKEQYVELLPARTVLSLLCGTTGTGTTGTATTGTCTCGCRRFFTRFLSARLHTCLSLSWRRKNDQLIQVHSG